MGIKMRVTNLLEAERWRPGKAKELFIAESKKAAQAVIDELQKIPFSANGKDLKAVFEVRGLGVARGPNHDYNDSDPYNPGGSKEQIRSFVRGLGIGETETEYRIFETLLILGTLSNGDRVEVELKCTSISNDPSKINFKSTIIGARIKRGSHAHYITLPKPIKSGGGGGLRHPTPRIQIVVKQLSKYQDISDKLGKSALAAKEAGMRKIKSMHANPSAIKNTIHTEIDDVTKSLKKLSIERQIGKLSDEEFRSKIVELTDRLRSF
jgi:hypothetical protein